MNEQLETLIASLIAAIPRAEHRTADFTKEATYKEASESWNDAEEALLEEQESRNYLAKGDVLVCGFMDRMALVMIGRGNGNGRTCHLISLSRPDIVIHRAGWKGGDNTDIQAVFGAAPQNMAGLRMIVAALQGAAT